VQFHYLKNAGDNNITIDKDLHKYLFKIRRQNIAENIFFRNFQDHNLYEYKVLDINKKITTLTFVNSIEKKVSPKHDLHIAWCIIDTKNIEKNIASLNELGVSKITFIRCNYSQSKYKINYDKLNTLLYNSSCQCGRSDIIKLAQSDNLKEFLKHNQDTYMFNFSTNHINNYKQDIKTILIGCEGGFSQKEIEYFQQDKIVGCNTNTILQSQTAVVSVASLVLF
jgi:16S rRNA (uracil1498-N3)-methyltransferase